MRTLAIAGVILLVIVGAVITLRPLAQGPGGSPFGGRTSTAPLQTSIVDKGDIVLTVTATGSVVAKQQTIIGFDQPGQIIELPVSQGQTVETGQLLAKQDNQTQQASVTQAEYQVKAAQAALDKLLQPVDSKDIAAAEADLKAAQGAYQTTAGSVSTDQIKAYELQYKQAQEAAKNADYIRAGAGGQYGSDDPNYQKTVAQVGQAQINAEIARLRLEQAKRGHSLLSATANIAFYQARLAQVKAGPKQVDIDDAQAQLETAKIQLQQAQHMLAKTQLVAPFGGTVTEVKLNQGEVAVAPFITIIDTSEMYVDVKVDESDIGKVRVGQPVALTFDALPGTTVTGKVQRIAQLAAANTSVITYTVRVTLDTNKAPVKIGMTANAIFTVAQVKNVTRVSNLYLKLNRTYGQTTVNLVNHDNSVSVIPVKLGLQGTDYSEVIDGLNEGETVALVATK